MSIGLALHRSVGKGGTNSREDVSIVQLLLNGWLGVNNMTLLKVDGICGPLTQRAINSFQSANCRIQDGRVDPHGPTLRALGDVSIQQLFNGLQNRPPVPHMGKPPAIAVTAAFWQQIASVRRVLT